MIHVSNLQRVLNASERQRLHRVYETWKNLAAHTGIKTYWPFTEQLPRTSKDIDPEGPVRPYFKDLIDIAFLRDDIVFLTNGDALICKDALDIVRLELRADSALYSHRRNFFRPCRNWLTCAEAKARGKEFSGVDSFAMTKGWWNRNKLVLPDLLMGCEAWDWVLRFEIGIASSIELTYHEHHMPHWFTNRLTSKSNLHNRKLAKQWAAGRSDYIGLLKVWPELDIFQ